jgi:hypothetical protein
MHSPDILHMKMYFDAQFVSAQPHATGAPKRVVALAPPHVSGGFCCECEESSIRVRPHYSVT